MGKYLLQNFAQLSDFLYFIIHFTAVFLKLHLL